MCLRWDLGIGAWDSTNLNVAVYLCNQMIYDPLRQRKAEARWDAISENRPLRCVLPLEDPGEQAVSGWIAAMKERYRLSRWREVVVDTAARGASPRTEHYFVYEFVPHESQAVDRGKVADMELRATVIEGERTGLAGRCPSDKR